MKSFHIALLTTLTCASVILAGVGLYSSSHQYSANRKAAFLPGLKKNIEKVDQITVTSGRGEQVSLVKTANTWVIKDKDNYPARQDGVLDALNQLAESTIVEEKTSQEKYFGPLGLIPIDKNNRIGRAITLAQGEQQWQFIIGDVVVGRGYYARFQDQQTAWLIKGRLNLPANPGRWLEAAVFEQDIDSIQSVTVASKNLAFRIHRESNKHPYTLTDSVGSHRVKNGSSRNLLARSLYTVVFEDVALLPENATPERTLVFNQFGGLKITANLYKTHDAHWVNLAFDGSDEATILNNKHSKWWYQIPSHQASALLVEPSQLVEKGDDLALN